ncbi:hypothetical protein WAI453_010012 [Rhynchosporium graminicola]
MIDSGPQSGVALPDGGVRDPIITGDRYELVYVRLKIAEQSSISRMASTLWTVSKEDSVLLVIRHFECLYISYQGLKSTSGGEMSK